MIQLPPAVAVVELADGTQRLEADLSEWLRERASNYEVIELMTADAIPADLAERIGAQEFQDELPVLLDDARRLGTKVRYRVFVTPTFMQAVEAARPHLSQQFA